MGSPHRLTLLAGVLLGSFGCAAQPEAPGDAVDSQEVATVTLSFAANFTQRASTTLRVGQRARIVYDASRLAACRGEQGGVPQWSITGYARLGDGETVSFPVAGLMAPQAAPTIPLDRAGELQVWFQNNNRWGCNAFDSDYGRNFRFRVALPANAPGWVGDGAWVLSRETCNGAACDAGRRPLTTPFDYDTWARQRAAIRAVFFDVWKAGVTDRDNPDLWRQLDVQVLSRPAGTALPWRARYVRFEARVGNNARYAIPMRDLDPLGENTVTRREDCPTAPLTRSEDGTYVRAELEYFVRVNGVEYRPAAGGTFRARFTQHRGLFDVCLAR